LRKFLKHINGNLGTINSKKQIALKFDQTFLSLGSFQNEIASNFKGPSINHKAVFVSIFAP
jgi:hypothetical protein